MACPFCGEHCFCPTADAADVSPTSVAVMDEIFPETAPSTFSEQQFEASLSMPSATVESPALDAHRIETAAPMMTAAHEIAVTTSAQASSSMSEKPVTRRARLVDSPAIAEAMMRENTEPHNGAPRMKRAFRNVTRSIAPVMVSTKKKEDTINPNRISLHTEGALAHAAMPDTQNDEWRSSISDTVAEHKAKRKKRTQTTSLDLFAEPLVETSNLTVMEEPQQATVTEVIPYVEPMTAAPTEAVVEAERIFDTKIMDLATAGMVRISEPAPMVEDNVLESDNTVHSTEEVAALMKEIEEAEQRLQLESENTFSDTLDPIIAMETPGMGFETTETDTEEAMPVMLEEPAPPPDMYKRIEMRAEERARIVEEITESTKSENNIIEFPRSASMESAETVAQEPMMTAAAAMDAILLEEELAEPVPTSPRILEAHAPTDYAEPSALETIRLDASEVDLSSDPAWVREYDESTTHLELPPQAAAFGQRVLSAAVDILWVLTATALFAIISTSITEYMPQGRMAVLALCVLPVFFWTAYQYLFLVFSGRTPGMQMAQLELTGFDGEFPNRKIRAQRAMAVLISCVSVGLGFLWAAVDEDHLGWHDRITKTYLREC
jgi:uncharacterized RDD family membrane protein YckC